MANKISKAMEALKNRFIDSGTTTEAFYLDKCENTTLDLVYLDKLFNIGITKFLGTADSFKIDTTPFSIHHLKSAISQGGEKALKAVKEIIPFFFEVDNQVILSAKTEKEVIDVTNKIFKKYITIFNDLEDTLANIKDLANQNKKLFGATELYVGYPFGECRFRKIDDKEEALFRGPLALLPINITIKEHIATISKAGNPIVNPNLIMVSQLIYKSKMDEIDGSLSSVNDFKAIMEIINKTGCVVYDKYDDNLVELNPIKKSEYVKTNNVLEGMKIVKHLVMGIFPIANKSLYKDFNDILNYEFDENSSFLKLIADEGKDNTHIQADLDEEKIKLMTPLDMYQGICVMEAMDKSFAVNGPPGTGKTQVITNIIFNAIDQNKRILVVTEKPVAIDVIENRLKDFSSNMINLEKINTLSLLKEKLNYSIDSIKAVYKEKPYYKLDNLYKYYDSYNGYLASFDQYANTGYTKEEMFKNALIPHQINAKLFELFNKNDFYKAEVKQLISNIYDFGLLNAFEKRNQLLKELDIDGLLEQASNNQINDLAHLVEDYIFAGEKNITKFASKQKKDGLYQELFNSKLKVDKILKKLEKNDNFDVNLLVINFDLENRDIELINYILKTNILKQELEIAFMDYLYKLWTFSSRGHFGFVEQYQKNLSNALTDLYDKVNSDSIVVRNNYRKHTINYLTSNQQMNLRITECFREINNNKKTIREIIDTYYDIFNALYTVVFATPATVSELIPLKEGIFDFVIFDEASQQTIEKSIPVIFRAKKIVACGDEKQMSPSQAFVRDVSNYEDETVEGYDSVEKSLIYSKSLLDFVSTQYNSATLNYHYRSQSHKLVNFSNKKFYKNELIIADIAKKLNKPIEVLELEGKYHDTKNVVEAEKAVELIFELVKTKSAKDTIGVIAMNKKQQDLIVSRLERKLSEKGDQEWVELKNMVSKELYDRPEDERIFIKNLESVQGDERDLIILSLVYGPIEEDGKIKYPSSFGPLAMVGGEKRLNVAITRAKKKMIVLKSIRSTDLTGTYKHPGVNVFKELLSSYENVDEIYGINSEFNSSNTLAVQMKEKIEKYLPEHIKLEFSKKIGSFVVDFAFYDTKKQTYVLGVKVEDASVNPSVRKNLFDHAYLKGRGWDVYYLFYHNWFRSADIEVKNILNKLK